MSHGEGTPPDHAGLAAKTLTALGAAGEKLSSATSASRRLVSGPLEGTEHKAAAYLMTAVTVIVGLFTTLGITGGVLGEMLLNHAAWAVAALVCAFLAVAVGFMALYVLPAKVQSPSLTFGLALFVAGAIAAIVAGVRTWGDQTPPRVTATIKRTGSGGAIAVNVTDGGLHATQRLILIVAPVLTASGDDLNSNGPPVTDAYEYTTGFPIYQSVAGPDAEGDAKIATTVLLPLGGPTEVVVHAAVGTNNPSDCLLPNSRAGCVILSLGSPGRPQLSAVWKSRALLHIRGSASMIGPESLYLAATVPPAAGRRPRQLALGQFEPNESESVAGTLDVAIPPDTQRVCIAASIGGFATCPPQVTGQMIRACKTQHKLPRLGAHASADAEARAKAVTAARQQCVAADSYSVATSAWVEITAPK